MSPRALRVRASEDDDARRPRLLSWLLWFGALAMVTAAMFAVRPHLDKAHVALAYLLLVLGAGASAGRRLGITLSVVSFFCFNFFFVPPHHTLFVAAPLDWLVLAAFLATGVISAQLLARAQSEARAARERTDEVDRLAALGAEALNAGRAEDALTTLAEVIRTTLRVTRCEIFVRDSHDAVTVVAASGTPIASEPLVGASDAFTGDASVGLEPFGVSMGGARLVEWVAVSGRAAVERTDGALRVGANPGFTSDPLDLDVTGAQTILLPLRVRDRTVGVLRLAHTLALSLDRPQSRFLAALSYYAALGVERLRLVAEAEHAHALREADALKNALLASVSHDLRTPLTTIKALAHDLRMEGHERAATIEEEADRLNRFVADLLDLSRLNGGAFTVTPELNAVEDLVGAALQRVSGMLREHELSVALDTAEPLLLGRFDFVHSLRIVVNLLENAAKYSPPGSVIELSAERNGDLLRIAVADRGFGVPAGEEERIFEPFYRPAGRPDTGGAGLGLSIARRMAEAQGGTVNYEPRADGGSVFVLQLAAADVAELGADATPSETL
ncbi:MAG: ATP-binding region ATPase domain protein [Gemmatimonadetes bacterium]|nr:ATP-binding region ATPase domain protein [Gemmatimonadota bacterium]